MCEGSRYNKLVHFTFHTIVKSKPALLRALPQAYGLIEITIESRLLHTACIMNKQHKSAKCWDQNSLLWLRHEFVAEIWDTELKKLMTGRFRVQSLASL